MEYTSDYINSLSFAEYIKLMATELNENGFKENGQYEYCSFENDPAMQRLFMMGPINDPKAMAFLKSKGLIENGRCPSCGAPMSVYRYTWSDIRDPSKKFYVCYGCAKIMEEEMVIVWMVVLVGHQIKQAQELGVCLA